MVAVDGEADGLVEEFAVFHRPQDEFPIVYSSFLQDTYQPHGEDEGSYLVQADLEVSFSLDAVIFKKVPYSFIVIFGGVDGFHDLSVTVE